MKECSSCHLNKSIDEFYRCKDRKDGHRGQCRVCWLKRTQQYKREYLLKPGVKEKIKQYHQKYWKKCHASKEMMSHRRMLQRNWWCLSRYGITTEEKEKILKDQKGKCAICETPVSDPYKANIDHSHKTGKVRGILCNNCNTALGLFKEDFKILGEAMLYLQKEEDSGILN